MTSRITIGIVLMLLIAAFLPAEASPSAPELYRRGQTAQQTEDYYRAIELYRQALEQNPGYADAMRGLAECYFYLDEYDTALTWIEKTNTYIDDDPDIMNLEARVRLGNGDIPAAAALFERVLTLEPNNLEALFGKAELDIVSGNIGSAARKYEDALRISPDNRKALLSLVLVYDSLGDIEKAEYFARRSIELHSDSAPAHYITARHFLNAGHLDDAEYHVLTALNLDPEDYRSMLLLCDIYIRTERYGRVLELGKRLVQKDRKNSQTWYVLGIAAWNSGAYEDARYYLNEAVHLQPDDEIARIALEQLLMDRFEPDHVYRKEAAEYHFNLGRRFIDKNLTADGLREYRRGLMLNPFSEEGRLLYGRVYRDRGNIPKYVSILEVLINEGTQRQEVLDDYEIYKSLLVDSVAESWDIDQFAHERDRYTLGLFFFDNQESSPHPGSGALLARYFRSLLFAYELIDPLEEQEVSGFAAAFREARNKESEYFIIMDVREIDRIVSLNLRVYNSETGTEVYETDLLRTGNGRIPSAYGEGAKRVNKLLVPRGRLVKRSFNTALIDLGRVDGLEEGDILDIIRQGGLSISEEDRGFVYDEADRLGEFTVTAVDELVSEGTVSRKAFFDMINRYDHVIPTVEKEEEDGEEAKHMPVPADLYRMLLRVR